MNIENGTIIRLKSDTVRDWVCIHHTKCEDLNIKKYRKHIKDHTGFYLYGGLWYDGDPLTSEPYGKTIGQLKVGMFNNIEIVGNVSVTKDLLSYKTAEKVPLILI